MQIFLLIFAVTLALTMWARQKYRTTYDEELKNVIGSGITGAELARRILAASGIERAPGPEKLEGLTLFTR